MMSMLNVKQEKNIVIIEGISVYDFKKDLARIWPKSIIENMTLSMSGSFTLATYDFFVTDLIYICRRLAYVPLITIQRSKYLLLAELLERNTWAISTVVQQPDILDYSQLAKLNVKLMDHQNEFLSTYNRLVPQYHLQGYMLSMPAGTGKTITSLALGLCLNANVTIIVAPNNSLYTVWESTLKTRFNKVPKIWVSQDKKPFTDDCQYYIFHFEAVEKAVELVKSRKFKRAFVVLDESHNFNEITSLRTNYFIELCQLIPERNVIWSSGTPIKALGAEVIPFLSTIDPMFNSKVVKKFKDIFGMNRTRGIEILSNRIGLVSFKTDKAQIVNNEFIVKDVMVKTKDADDYTLDNIRLDMKRFIEERSKYYKANLKEYIAIYEEALKYFEGTEHFKQEQKNYTLYKSYIAQIRKGYDPIAMKDMVIFCNSYEKRVIAPTLKQPLKATFLDARSVVKYLELKIQGECLGRILGRKRIDCYRSLISVAPLANIIEDSAKKTVIFSSYVDVVDDVNDVLIKEKLSPLIVYGDTNSMVTAIVHKFETDPNANPMIATFKSLSTAVPLIVANSIIMMNTPFRDYEYQQAVSRCHRLGQDTQVYVYRVMLDTGELPNISTRSKDIMEWSKQQVNLLLGITTDIDSDLALECMDLTTEDVFGSSAEAPETVSTESSRALEW